MRFSDLIGLKARFRLYIYLEKPGLFTPFRLTADLLPGIRVRVRTGDTHAVTHQRTALQVPGL
jgi:hypothetical protein